MRKCFALAESLTGKRASFIESPSVLFSLATVYVVVSFFYIGRLHGLWNGTGGILGDDFANAWTAAKLALNSQISTIFDPAAFHNVQEKLLGGSFVFHSFSYPPSILFLILPFGLLPYATAWILWSALGLAVYFFALRSPRFLGFNLLALIALAPSSFENAVAGHYGFFLAALFVGGLRLLPTQPFLAGLVLGALSVKPQLALLLPFALLAGGHYKALGGMVLSSFGLIGLSALVFGPEAWMGFFQNVLPQQEVLLKLPPLYVYQAEMPTVFAALRFWGLPPAVAMAGQMLVTLGTLIAVMRVFRDKHRPWGQKAAFLCAAALLATPYALAYDMTLTSAALLLYLETRTAPLSFGANTLLFAVWLLPLVLFWLNALSLPLGPALLIAVCWLIARPNRAEKDGKPLKPIFSS